MYHDSRESVKYCLADFVRQMGAPTPLADKGMGIIKFFWIIKYLARPCIAHCYQPKVKGASKSFLAKVGI